MKLNSTTVRYGRKVPKKLVPNRELTIARIKKGWNVNKLASEAGLSGNTVLAAEAGFYVEPPTQIALARTLGENQLDLFPLERQKEFKR